MTAAERKHYSKVAALGCCACEQLGYFTPDVEIHHIRETAGAGQKSDYTETIPLCVKHHRGTHHPQISSIHLDRNNFIEQFGTELELLAKVKERLSR